MEKYIPTPQDFDTWAATLDQDILAYADKFPFIGYSNVINEIVKQAMMKPGASVLDLGVGTGNLAGRFLTLGCPVYGLDFSPKMLDVARAKFPQLHLTRADLLGSAWSAAIRKSFDRTRFDAIVSGYTFHHFPLSHKLRLLVTLAARHLSPAGLIVIGDIAFQDAGDCLSARARWGALWDEEDYWIADETLEACQKAALQVSYSQISSCAGVFAIQPGKGFKATKEPL